MLLGPSRAQALLDSGLVAIQLSVPGLLTRGVRVVDSGGELEAFGSYTLTPGLMVPGAAGCGAQRPLLGASHQRSPTSPMTASRQGTRTISVWGETWMSHRSFRKFSSKPRTSRF